MRDRSLGFEFILPKGAIVSGVRHVRGKMRPTTGQDELAAREHPLARENPYYAWLVLLARAIVCLGNLDTVEAADLENLSIADSIYLKNFYRQINPWQGDDPFLGDIPLYPHERLYREVATIAFYFHWSLAEILLFEHRQRWRWLEEINRLRSQSLP